ncbi:MAG: rRNA maturation RNase YbeY [Candidatus Sumerlaeia bacterium]|nr:rRNA maturation RNase YbeY [Candidatus Sumerlaeia bacterium]
MNIEFKNRSKSKSITNYRLKKLCREIFPVILEATNQSGAEISILFVGDEEMIDFNRHYRNEPETTDVLAFPMCDGRFPNVGPNILGDIIISIPTAKRQAEEQHHSLEKELAILLIHGYLHLLGYDDEKPSQRKMMRKREQELLQILKKRRVLS